MPTRNFWRLGPLQTRMPHRPVALAAALVVLAAAGEAAAATRVPYEQISSAIAEPVVLPEGTVDVRNGLARNRPRVTFTSPSGRLRLLRQFNGLMSVVGRLGGDESYSEEANFLPAASARWIAVAMTRIANLYDGASETSEIEYSDIEVARRSGRARRLVRCKHFALVPVVAGSILARNDCGASGVVVHDLDAPGSPGQRFTFAPGFRPRVLAVAGGYVLARLEAPPRPALTPPPAVAPEQPVVLLDRATGQEAARTNGLAVTHAALREDGTAVLVAAPANPVFRMSDGCGDTDLALFVLRPGGGAAPLGLEACDGPVSIDGDRVLFARPPKPTFRTWALTNVAGAPPRDIGFVLEPTLTGRGDLVRLRESTCVVWLDRFSFVTLGALLERGAPEPDRCTLRFRSRTARVDRRGFARIRYTCPAGCDAGVKLAGYGGGSTLRTRARTSAVTGVEVPPRLLARLRRQGRVTVEATVSLAVLDGRVRQTFNARLVLRLSPRRGSR